MTRWARANNIHKRQSTDPAPWSQLRSGPAGGTTDSVSKKGGFSNSQRNGAWKNDKKANKRKSLDSDVNGYTDYLKRTGQQLPRGPRGLQRATELEQNTDDVEATALNKVKQRENRRIKRQNDKKNKMVCFNCRKPGHGVSDCPEAKDDEEMGQGICYRCGSTEHGIQKCRAKVDPAMGDYPYAKCFICEKTGHLSRSCPDNPKGLYAAGGCCHFCGSVEHFQKDCPDHQTSTNSITVRRISNRISADHEDVHVPVLDVPRKKAKVVVF